MTYRKYRDRVGRVLFVSSGISGGSAWMTVIAKGPNSSKRYRGIEPTSDKDTAQKALDAKAAKEGWTELQDA